MWKTLTIIWFMSTCIACAFMINDILSQIMIQRMTVAHQLTSSDPIPVIFQTHFINSAFYWIAHSLAHHLNILIHVCYSIHIKDDGYSSNTRTPRRIILSKGQNAALTFLAFRKYAPTFHSNSSICMHLKKQTCIHAYL